MSDTAVPAPAPMAERHLYHPLVDWLLLGGSSLFILPLMMLLPSDRWKASVLFAVMVAANFINHPHFAHSYQIFYRGFREKLFAGEAALRWRYALAGIAVPILLVGYFAVGLATDNVRMVALGYNLMGLAVGWHYVKQGYGMLMVDAAFKRRFFSDDEKKLLLINAYAVWVFAWLKLNELASDGLFWGVKTVAIPMPHWLVVAGGVIALAGLLTVITMLFKRHRAGKKLPWSGLTAYGVTLYLWTVFPMVNPLFFLVIPALHSLQYLAVVYRFQGNVAHAGATPSRSARGIVVRFAVVGLVFGALLFWLIPLALSAQFQFRPEVYGTTLFVFIGWIVINVHHYFMDSVMWRRGNPETSRHLFGR